MKALWTIIKLIILGAVIYSLYLIYLKIGFQWSFLIAFFTTMIIAMVLIAKGLNQDA